ncbi:response regulator [Blastococcus sp. SYSU D00813]
MLIAEDEPYLADAVRAGLRLEAIASDVVHDGDSALENLAVNAYDVVVLDRDLPGTPGDEVARRIVADGLACRILMLTAGRAPPRRPRPVRAGSGAPAAATLPACARPGPGCAAPPAGSASRCCRCPVRPSR